MKPVERKRPRAASDETVGDRGHEKLRESHGNPATVATEEDAELRQYPGDKAAPVHKHAAGAPKPAVEALQREKHTDDAVLDDLQRKAFHFFERHVDPETGLVLDSTQPDSPSSIAAVGFALSCYPVAVERGWMSRKLALSHSVAAARFFANADQSGAPDGVGYKGFYYHFLHADTGRRAWESELSTIDTALLIAGFLLAAQYFSGDSAAECEFRQLVQTIYARADWRWAQDGEPSITMGWKPESGFLKCRWFGYNEALLLYVLALAASQFDVQPDAYEAWTSTFRWRRVYGHDVLYGGPLFIHQFSHVWLDLRGIQDEFMRGKKTDYFENSRVSTLIQREYGARNPRKFAGYEKDCWGFTASDGPGDGKVLTVKGSDGKKRRHRFYGYIARGAPYGPDDGTLSPWAAIASLPFAPDIVMDAVRYLEKLIGHSPKGFGFHASFNPSYPDGAPSGGWVSPWHYALNQGPIVLMIENYRTGLIWRLMRECAPIRLGLQRAGFEGGWLSTRA
ncbi:MAG TPA: glucoamylase family protein [Rhodanobacteraceae bacterium]|nr:glucoamylase family protein [Rhodanobacteraceae bacterium]